MLYPWTIAWMGNSYQNWWKMKLYHWNFSKTWQILKGTKWDICCSIWGKVFAFLFRYSRHVRLKGKNNWCYVAVVQIRVRVWGNETYCVYCVPKSAVLSFYKWPEVNRNVWQPFLFVQRSILVHEPVHTLRSSSKGKPRSKAKFWH